jgi:amidase
VFVSARNPVTGTGTLTEQQACQAIDHDVEGLLRFTAIANATGCPAVVLTRGLTEDRRPVGFQLLGAHLADADLLRIAHAYQQASEWHAHHPALD